MSAQANRFSTVVVGIDGGTGGAAALALAKALAAPSARFLLVNAYPVVGPVDELVRDSLDALARAAEVCPGAETVAVPDHHPARALHTVAAHEHADLIVVGAGHHRTRTGRALLGDVAVGCVYGTPCPTAIAPLGFTAGHVDTIGVGFDDSAEAHAALDVAVGLAQRSGASLRVRTVSRHPAAFTPTDAYAFDWERLEEEYRTEAQEALDAAVADLPVPVATEVTSGTPARDLGELSASVDLLIVGSRGRGAVRSVLLGSAAGGLARSARCPLLVVPRAHERVEVAA